MTDEPVLEHVIVYEYGKLLSPRSFVKEKKCHSGQRSRNVNTKSIDRPALISKIHNLLDIHKTQRENNKARRTVCSIHIHKALLKAIRLCYECKICESKLFPVGDLFLELFLCLGNSCAIFSVLFDGHMSTVSHLINTDVNILYPTTSPEENHSAFEYYLQHISSIRHGEPLDFINMEIGHYSVTTPLSAAVQKRDPALVLLLLRYGADPFYEFEDSSIEDRIQNPTEQLIDDLNGLFLFKNTGFSEETRAKLRAEEEKVWECLKYFRRAVVEIPLSSTNHVNTVHVEDGDIYSHYEDDRIMVKQTYGIHPGIAENINFDFFKPTVSLKHMCRCSIRNQLNTNRSNQWSILKGISLLPLPSSLKQYLDLQSD